MKNTNILGNKTSKAQQFCRDYFQYLYRLLNEINTGAIELFIKEIEASRRNQNMIFFIGNGGSAATASHIVNDLSFGSRKDNKNLPIRALSLSDNAVVMTASANDCGYENLFVRQLKIHYRPGDRLVAISASGNSPNIISAAKWVKEQSGRVIGIVGFDGGRLKDIADLVIHVKTPEGEYGPVEDIHMILGHLLYMWIWHREKIKSQE